MGVANGILADTHVQQAVLFAKQAERLREAIQSKDLTTAAAILDVSFPGVPPEIASQAAGITQQGRDLLKAIQQQDQRAASRLASELAKGMSAIGQDQIAAATALVSHAQAIQAALRASDRSQAPALLDGYLHEMPRMAWANGDMTQDLLRDALLLQDAIQRGHAKTDQLATDLLQHSNRASQATIARITDLQRLGTRVQQAVLSQNLPSATPILNDLLVSPVMLRGAIGTALTSRREPVIQGAGQAMSVFEKAKSGLLELLSTRPSEKPR
jgi:hypothetical protein